MFNYIFKSLFAKKNKVTKKTLTILNENRESTLSRRSLLSQFTKDERQKTCLSKYFENIKGLNTIERNIYSKII